MLRGRREESCGSSGDSAGVSGASQENDLSIANSRCRAADGSVNTRKRQAHLSSSVKPAATLFSKHAKCARNAQKSAAGSLGSREGCSRGARKSSSLKSFCAKSGDLNMAELDAAVENAKNKIAEIPPEIYQDLISRGLIPCTLEDVLRERNKKWARKQQLDTSAAAEQERLLKAYQDQCSGWGNNREGWIHGKWHNVIVCPDFKKSCLQVSRSAMRELWLSLVAVVNGFVDPNLVICRVDDPTHPVRFATPPEETCYTVVYVGEPIRGSRERRPLGEYTGVVREGKANKQRFEYVFDLSFCASAWRAAEEFECDSDSSDEEASASSSPSTGGHRSTEGNRAGGEEVKASKRCVQVTRARGLGGLKRVELPARGEFVLDSHEAFNQMSLVNHYGTIGLLGDRICHMNTEWQQVFVDGWPHIVLTTVPNVDINPGDEVLADFGWSWFNKVEDASHEAIARELLEYRLGKRNGPNQSLAPGRPEHCLNRRRDPALQCRARVGEICPYCQSDEHRQRGREENPWGERVVHCDGCDRPCHLRCIFAAHGVEALQLGGAKASACEGEEETSERNGPSSKSSQSVDAESGAAEAPHECLTLASNCEAAVGNDCVFDITEEEGGREVSATERDETQFLEEDENYRWFTDYDYKWYCCVCRLQWERMARAMNFTIDWESMQVLRAGNHLIPPSTEQSELRAAELRNAVSLKEGGPALEAKGACGKDNSVTGIPVLDTSDEDSDLPKKKRCCKASTKGPRKRQPPSAERRLRRRRNDSPGATSCFGEMTAPASDETPSKSSRPDSPSAASAMDAQESHQGRATEQKSKSGDCAAEEAFGVAVSVPPPGLLKCQGDLRQISLGTNSEGGETRSKEPSFRLVVEKVRVYATPSEKETITNMQPSPAAIIPQEMTREELLGCKTNVVNERRGLLGSLQPCLKCYRLLGARASVEVCRLTKRHLQPNWDHPHFVSPVQIQDALLTCFQDGLLAVQSEYRGMLKECYAELPPHLREQRVQQLLRGDRKERILEDAGSRNAGEVKPHIEDRSISKGYIPLLGVRLGKTFLDMKFEEGWFRGCVTEYDPAPVDDGTVYANQFKIEYEDGDKETVTAETLVRRLVAPEGPRTTPLAHILDPMMKQAKKLSSIKLKAIKGSRK